MGVWAAIIMTALLAGLAVFQLALAAGAPLGRFSWGGQHRRLSTGLRIGSAVAIPIYAAIAAVELQSAGLTSAVFPEGWLVVARWVVFGYLVLGIPLNAASRSLPERAVMTPLAAVLAGLALLLALGV